PQAERKPIPALLAPRHHYAAGSQGAWAQQLALDLGLIQQRDQDALGPLSGAGIAPAGYWQVMESPTAQTGEEVGAAARRRAAAGRRSLSADGAEAVVRQAAAAYLPAINRAAEQRQDTAPAAVEEPAEGPGLGQDPPVVIIEQPPTQTIVVHEPVYV